MFLKGILTQILCSASNKSVLFFFFYSVGQFATNYCFLVESQYIKFSTHSQSTCIIRQHKTWGCWTPGCPNTDVPQKKQLLSSEEASEMDIQKGQQV